MGVCLQEQLVECEQPRVALCGCSLGRCEGETLSAKGPWVLIRTVAGVMVVHEGVEGGELVPARTKLISRIAIVPADMRSRERNTE